VGVISPRILYQLTGLQYNGTIYGVDKNKIGYLDYIDVAGSFGYVTRGAVVQNYSIVKSECVMVNRQDLIARGLLEESMNYMEALADFSFEQFEKCKKWNVINPHIELEVLEKRMRLEDAICALSVCNNGIMLGGGISLLQIAENIKETNEASKIWKKALEEPFIQILKNAGLEEQSIIKKIQQEEYNILYNVTKNQFELCGKSTVVDPYDVVAYAIRHACSIATMLLTTTSLVINEKKNASYIGTQESEL